MRSVKRLMGRARADVQYVENLPYDFAETSDHEVGMLHLRTAGGVKSPVEVSAEILRCCGPGPNSR